MAITIASMKAVLDLEKKGFDDGMQDVQNKTGGLKKVLGGAKKAVLGVTTAAAGLGVGVAAGIAGAVDASIGLQKELDNTRRRFQDFKSSDQDILSMQQNAEKLGRAFEVDVNSVMDSAAVLMSEFGATSDEAFDLIAQGLDKGLNTSDDFLDTISEYSNVVQDAGFSLGQFYDLMQQGQKGGVLGTDKIIDAVKEMNVRILEGSDDTKEALMQVFGYYKNNSDAIEEQEKDLAKLNKEYDKLVKKDAPMEDIQDVADKIDFVTMRIQQLNAENGQFVSGTSDAFRGIGDLYSSLRDGSADVEDVFQEVTMAIQGIEDPVQKAALATAVFGSMAEDLGADMLGAFDVGATGVEDFAGKTDEVAQKFPSIGVFIKDAMDQGLLAMKPLTDELIRLANEYGPMITEFFEEASPVIEEWAKNFGPALIDALKSVMDSLIRIGKAMGIINPEAEGMTAGVEGLGAALDGITSVLGAIAWGFEKIADAIEIASGLLDQFRTIIGHIDGIQGLGQVITATQNALFAEGAGMARNLLGFAQGGVVPGPTGMPQLAMVHGGERIIPAGDSGGQTTVININGINVANSQGQDLNESLSMAFEILRMKVNDART